LHTGCDFHLSYENIQDAIDHPRNTPSTKRVFAGRVFELLIFKNTEEIFARCWGCRNDSGDHPSGAQRCSCGSARDTIAQWVETGARRAGDGAELTGGASAAAQQDFSRELLDGALVHVIASDGHDCERRPPVMDQARAWLGKHYGDSLARRCGVTNPGAALLGDAMRLPDAEAESPVRKWYQFWR
jgi:protein-tyrosine phosphatase